MTRGPRAQQGFTLIELLTVIAIIGVLAALTAAVLPRALERARVTNVQSTMLQLRTALVDYLADNASLPAMYGYVNDSGRGFPPGALLDAVHRVYRPYTWDLGFHANFDLYDSFANDTTDTNRDNRIDLLEFSPVGSRSTTQANKWDFVPEIYNLSNLNFEVNAQLSAQRPIIYIPVNKRMVQQAANYWYQINRDDPRPRASDPVAGSPFQSFVFPPANYNAAVLISLGPDGHTRGILPGINDLPASVTNGVAAQYAYHLLGIVAYYLATRDADGNGQLDFDFIARTRNGEAKNPNNRLPDVSRADGVNTEAPDGQGPLILAFE